jgi:hypothetical protein
LKKKTFLLLEILIALMLVVLCATPLIVEPVRLYRTEMKRLEEVEAERLANWTFSEIKEKLLKHEIPWKMLPIKEGPSIAYPLEAAPLQIPGRSAKIIHRSFSLKCRREKEGPQGEIYRIFDVNIYFEPRLCTRKKRKTVTGEKISDYPFKLTIRKLLNLPVPSEGHS